MKIYLKYDINAVCKKILQEQLDKLELNYNLIAFGEVEIRETVSAPKLKHLTDNLNIYGIQIVETQKSILVQKIKDAIMEMVHMEEKLPNSKISAYLADKLKHSYGYLSNIFTEVTFTSIENFMILQKIERAKQLITTNELTFNEIAWRLNYSSVAHLSTQFRKITGLTPSLFKSLESRDQCILANQ